MATLFKRNGRGAWRIGYFDHTGTRRWKSSRCTDKAAAQRIANKLEADAALRRESVIDARHDAFTDADRRPIEEHVADYAAALTAKGGTSKHVAATTARVRTIIDLSKAGRVSDMTGGGVLGAVAELRGRGASLNTCEHYIRAAKMFARWLVRDGRIATNPLSHVQTSMRSDTEPVHVRRCLTDEECAALIAAAEAGPIVLGMSGADRAMVYRVALGTGFRAAELRSLTVDAFNLDGDPPSVTVEAGSSKRRKRDVQPIRRDLADAMKPFLAGKTARVQPFKGLPAKTAAMMRRDLDAAGLAYADDAGRVADFHSLRHTYITRLVNGGASVKVAQELARHSTPTLTIGRYAHVRMHDLSGALDALPSLTPAGTEAARATGTYGAPTPPVKAQHRRNTSDAKHGNSLRTVANAPPQGSEGGDSGLSLQNKGFREHSRAVAACRQTAPPGTRTPDPLIKSQLLYQLS